MTRIECVLLVSDTSKWSTCAFEFLRNSFRSVEWYAWDYGSPHSRSFNAWGGCDLLLTFKADLVIPDEMLLKVREFALNIHPSIPRYRGIGGYRYALDDGCEEFGSTCHFLTSQIDSGPIIDVSRFPIYAEETEESLRERTAGVALGQLYRVVDGIRTGRALVPNREERWGARLYTRAALERYRAERGRRVMR